MTNGNGSNNNQQEPRAKSQEPRAKSQEPRANAHASDVASVSDSSDVQKKPKQASSEYSHARTAQTTKTTQATQNTRTETLIKSKRRVKKFGEVFTPKHIVQQMCDMCEPDISRIDSKVFEPTCGNGNFLVEILRRKLRMIKTSCKRQKASKNTAGSTPKISEIEFLILQAVSNIYAVDIQMDNVHEARKRMRGVVFEEFPAHNSKDFLIALDTIITSNIIVGDTLGDKKALIFFDFIPCSSGHTFEVVKHTLKDIEQRMENSKVCNVSNLGDTLEYLKSPPPKKAAPIPKRKAPPVGKALQQAELF